MRLAPTLTYLLGLLLIVTGARAASSFASRVVEYMPAPGQFVQNSAFNDPARALGPPSGGGTFDADNGSVVTLGGFGGHLILAFVDRVMDDPLNPMGLDAIVFSNAIWSSDDAQLHWAECATIELAIDGNENGLADDPWYLIPGSHIGDAQGASAVMSWDNNTASSQYPPSSASWIPAGRSGVWSTYGYHLPEAVFGQPIVANPLDGTTVEAIYGYADYTPTLRRGDVDADNEVDDANMLADLFYTVPDDPTVVGVTPGSGGGDAFDIAWAIDPWTGESAELPGFDFIKITNGVHAVHPLLGEKSPEIDAVADVRTDATGDADGDGDIDLGDIAAFDRCISSAIPDLPMCRRLSYAPDAILAPNDLSVLLARMTGPLEAPNEVIEP